MISGSSITSTSPARSSAVLKNSNARWPPPIPGCHHQAPRGAIQGTLAVHPRASTRGLAPGPDRSPPTFDPAVSIPARYCGAGELAKLGQPNQARTAVPQHCRDLLEGALAGHGWQTRRPAMDRLRVGCWAGTKAANTTHFEGRRSRRGSSPARISEDLPLPDGPTTATNPARSRARSAATAPVTGRSHHRGQKTSPHHRC